MNTRQRKQVISRYKGISLDDYNKMLMQQQGLCAICGKGSDKSLCIDHCHVTQRIRGLLCNNCNKGLGLFKDNPNIVQKALQYLRKTDAR